MDVEFLKYKFRDGYNGVITKTKWRVGVRHVQVTYMLLCAAALGALRASAGVALLALTDTSRRNDSYVQMTAGGEGERGAALWAFFSGYALALLPAELYLPRLGDKFVITAVLLINGSLTALMPTIVNKGSWTALCNAYFLMGMTQPCIAPVNRALLDNWLPPIERQTAACIIDTEDAACAMAQHAALPARGGAGARSRRQQRSVRLLLSGRTAVPQVNRTLAATGTCGVQAMMPFICLLTLFATTAPTLRCLLKSNLMAHLFNVTYTKIVVNVLGSVPIVAGLAMSPNMPEQWSYLRLCVLTVTLGLLAFQYSGFIENVRDLSENYRGMLIAITSAFASVLGAAVPLVTGIILRNHQNETDAWRVVFCCMAGLYGVCSTAGGAAGGAGFALWDRTGGRDFAYHNTGLSPEDASQLELLDMYPKKPMAATPSETIS
ncbi:PREDICTED: uncharacterized protein LOC106127085 isoform X4 [Papilio xuthus]|uniref:Uncharacterized protein LOC106127085 isoform X4 n=1 Tax=Papilio xuthus TaxID=66420 RepID=A0AAJ6ZWT9_PAPXU|nr:PREDICTED: uncharacterized protein LOC106127085 isoform X4 [Papilio xuthus]